MEYQLREEGKFRYIETEGKGETLMLLHGLFGALSNFQDIINHFAKTHNVVVPMLPIFDLPIRKVGLEGFVDHVIDFVAFKNYGKVHVLGNSLGGHISLLYALAKPEQIRSITLTGSSGLFENSLGSTFPKRGNYEFITCAKSAVRHNLGDKLYQIKAPTLLIWGKDDPVTPKFVGEKFNELIDNSQLFIVDKCGHAPMMERPEVFNKILADFLMELANQKETI